MIRGFFIISAFLALVGTSFAQTGLKLNNENTETAVPEKLADWARKNHCMPIKEFVEKTKTYKGVITVASLHSTPNGYEDFEFESRLYIVYDDTPVDYASLLQVIYVKHKKAKDPVEVCVTFYPTPDTDFNRKGIENIKSLSDKIEYYKKSLSRK